MMAMMISYQAIFYKLRKYFANQLVKYYTTSFSVIISFAGSISWTFLGARSSWALRWPLHSSMPSRSSWPSSISSEILRAFFWEDWGWRVAKVLRWLRKWMKDWIYGGYICLYIIYIGYIHDINICKKYIYTYVHIHGSLVNPGVSLSNLRGSPKGVAHPQ